MKNNISKKTNIFIIISIFIIIILSFILYYRQKNKYIENEKFIGQIRENTIDPESIIAKTKIETVNIPFRYELKTNVNNTYGIKIQSGGNIVCLDWRKAKGKGIVGDVLSGIIPLEIQNGSGKVTFTHLMVPEKELDTTFFGSCDIIFWGMNKVKIDDIKNGVTNNIKDKKNSLMIKDIGNTTTPDVKVSKEHVKDLNGEWSPNTSIYNISLGRDDLYKKITIQFSKV